MPYGISPPLYFFGWKIKWTLTLMSSSIPIELACFIQRLDLQTDLRIFVKQKSMHKILHQKSFQDGLRVLSFIQTNSNNSNSKNDSTSKLRNCKLETRLVYSYIVKSALYMYYFCQIIFVNSNSKTILSPACTSKQNRKNIS